MKEKPKPQLKSQPPRNKKGKMKNKKIKKS